MKNSDSVTQRTLTYLLVDGENIDATLGSSILQRRPESEERPRWERVRSFAEEKWKQPVRPLFFLNSSSGHLPMSFVQALQAMEYVPIPLTGAVSRKVVDEGILRTLDALRDLPGDIMVASHDGDFLEAIEDLLDDGNRKIGLVGFTEFFNIGFTSLSEDGLHIFDLERDVDAFQKKLPRMRIIDIDDFDPMEFL